MTKPVQKSISQPAADIASGTVLVSLSAGTDDNLPVEIQLAPAGKIQTRDARNYEFDPAALVARFEQDGVEIPIDKGHTTLQPGAGGAIGWIKQLTARAEGLFGTVEWLDEGKATLKARTHRYISPTFRHDESGRATWVHSVALVSAPALSMPAIASTDLSTETPDMSKFAAALGLAEDADDNACLDAIAALQADAEKKPGAVSDETLAQLKTTSEELAALKADRRKERVDGVLEGALKAKKIVPAQRDQYEALCATDDGLEQVSKLLDAMPAQLKASGLDERDVPDTDGEVDPQELAALAATYQAEQERSGIMISTADAVAHVQKKKSA